MRWHDVLAAEGQSRTQSTLAGLGAAKCEYPPRQDEHTGYKGVLRTFAELAVEVSQSLLRLRCRLVRDDSYTLGAAATVVLYNRHNNRGGRQSFLLGGRGVLGLSYPD